MKSLIRRFIPERLINLYHLVLARVAQIVYGDPSNKLIVIGVTGTNGKSSTCQFIGRFLESQGHSVGWTTTAGFKIGNEQWENDQKMTMLGRFQTQKMLRRMLEAGCTHAIIETSSQGVVQSRHVGVNYDVAVFTNLTPEHIESHGGFENYKRAKVAFFRHTARGKRKIINGNRMEKIAVVNTDDPHAQAFCVKGFDQIFSYSLSLAQPVTMTATGTTFTLEQTKFHLPLVGTFQCLNVLAAITTLKALGHALADLAHPVARVAGVPGRLELIDEGQSFGVVVDYAHEPAAVQAIYAAIEHLNKGRLIHVLGSCGGGRDVAQRKTKGMLAAQGADLVIVTNEDPYDEDPQTIIDDVAQGARDHGKVEGRDLFLVLDRTEAIAKAFALASPKDLVLITGKGNERVMALAQGEKIPWDDREVARAQLQPYAGNHASS